VTVHDPDRLTTPLWMQPHNTWVEEHHERLARVREAWPSEVVETSPMTYEWITRGGRPPGGSGTRRPG
jgi:hypothetical protein